MIATVRGVIDSTALGAVSMHEHLALDATALHLPGVETLDPNARMTPSLAGAMRFSQLAVRDNLRLDDDAATAAELADAGAAGTATVVECTSLGLGPRPAALPEISRRSGVQVVAAYGAYLTRGLPHWYATLDEPGRERLFVTALTDAVPGARYRAAMLGIMGTTAEFAPDADEAASLRAAARAAAATGAAVSIRLDPTTRNAHAVLDVVAQQGLALDRVVLTNVDEYPDPDYLLEVANRGPVLEVCFGGEGGHVPRLRNMHDADRLDLVLALLDSSYPPRIVLGTSLWTKAQQARLGGPGYGHLPRRVLPALRACGASERALTSMTHDEPARLLDRPVVADDHPQEARS